MALVRQLPGGIMYGDLIFTALASPVAEVRTPKYWPIGIFTGLSYINIVAGWGDCLAQPGLVRDTALFPVPS